MLNVMAEEMGFERSVDRQGPECRGVLIKAMGEFSLNQQARNSGWHTEDTPGRRMSVSTEDPQQDLSTLSTLAQALSVASVLASLERESRGHKHTKRVLYS